MKILIDSYGVKSDYPSLESYASSKLDGDDYGNGVMEAAADTAANNSKAIGRLLDLLADKGFVTVNDVVTVVEGYVSGEVKFDLTQDQG